MNERIRQLAIEAGLEMCICGCDMPTRQSAKFAELIVQECLELVAGFYYYDDRTCHYARPRIRQHFGIEQ
jgi:hypothetical protein